MKLFPLMALNALVIWGVHCATGPGEVGAPIGKFAEEELPEWVAKPTVACPPCMSSVWGSLLFWTIGPRDAKTFPFYILALSGLMRFVVRYGR